MVAGFQCSFELQVTVVVVLAHLSYAQDEL